MAEIDYRNQVTRLIERQLSDWDVAKHNYGALKACKLRSLRVGASSIVLQFNPERIRSSAAKVIIGRKERDEGNFVLLGGDAYLV